MQTINVSDQFAANSITQNSEFPDTNVPLIETPLQHANMRKLAARTASVQGVTLIEKPVTGLLVLRAGKDKSALQSALSGTLQLALPDVLASSSTQTEEGAYCVRWMAPDEWLLSCPLSQAFAIEQNLRASLEQSSVAFVNVSGGFTTLILRGVHAIDVLHKSTAYDVHPVNFFADKVVNTVFAKAQVTLRCIDADHYELIIRRSFADYVWHWIQIAAAEYGLNIDIEPSE